MILDAEQTRKLQEFKNIAEFDDEFHRLVRLNQLKLSPIALLKAMIGYKPAKDPIRSARATVRTMLKEQCQ